MNIMASMRTMKSMSMVEGEPSKPGGVLGGVFAGIRDTMSNSVVDDYKGNSIGNLSIEGGGNTGPCSFSSGNHYNCFFNNTHSISNSIGNSINNVTYASSKINGNASRGLFSHNGLYNSSTNNCNVPSNSKPENKSSEVQRSETVSSCSSEASSPGVTSSMYHLTPAHAATALKAMNNLRSNVQVSPIKEY